MRLLCLNVGSSSLKAAAFVADLPNGHPVRVKSQVIDRIAGRDDFIAALATVTDALDREGFEPDAIVHRFVHGGPEFTDHAVIDGTERAKLEAAVPFAPLHLPLELAVLDASRARYRACVQIACIDTAFHRHLPPVARRLPLPSEIDAAGIRRYGFHGLSYEFLVYRLGVALGRRAVLAHLGNGASLAAVQDGHSVDTTMGLTPSGGLVMSTRTGDLDPGVLVHLLRTRSLDADQVERLVNRESGLLGISGRSGDVRELLAARDRGDPRAALALDIYETAAAKHIAAMTAVLGGLDTLVFTAGVGEHASTVRAGICAHLEHLEVTVDGPANDANASVISRAEGPVSVRVVPTDEELMMAMHAVRLSRGR